MVLAQIYSLLIIISGVLLLQYNYIYFHPYTL